MLNKKNECDTRLKKKLDMTIHKKPKKQNQTSVNIDQSMHNCDVKIGKMLKN